MKACIIPHSMWNRLAPSAATHSESAAHGGLPQEQANGLHFIVLTHLIADADVQRAIVGAALQSGRADPADLWIGSGQAVVRFESQFSEGTSLM